MLYLRSTIVTYYLSVKICPCSLWVEIFGNSGIYILVWLAFCHRNFFKFYFKMHPYYIKFWNTKTLLFKLRVKWRVKKGIFSLFPRVIPSLTSQLITIFFMHFVWFTNWSDQNFCKKMGWVKPSWGPRLFIKYVSQGSKCTSGYKKVMSCT